MSTLKIDALKNNGSAIDLPNGIKVGGNEIVQGYTSSGTEPASPVTGDFWWDSTNELLYQYVNGEFKAIGIVVPSGAYGPDPFSSFPVSASGSNSVAYSDFDDPTLISTTTGNSITDTQYWHRLQLTPTLLGQRRLIFKLQLPTVVKASADTRQFPYNSDVQIAGVIHRSGPTTTEYYFTEARDHGFETSSTFTTGASTSSQPTSWSAISTTATPTEGKFGLSYSGGNSPSTSTGRLVPPSPISSGASTLSFMYPEMSGTAFGDIVWMRSPTITIAEGDIIEVLMGEDAVAAQSFLVTVQ